METGLDTLKTASKKIGQKAAEAAGGFIGNKTADAVAKSKHDKIVKAKAVEEIIIPTGKIEEILREVL